jgi:hypothetical protein
MALTDTELPKVTKSMSDILLLIITLPNTDIAAPNLENERTERELPNSTLSAMLNQLLN